MGAESGGAFLQHIGRTDLREVLIPQKPWLYASAEMALGPFSFAGGLGVLAGDILNTAGRLGLPLYGLSIYYPQRLKQDIHVGHYDGDGDIQRFFQVGERRTPFVTPEQAGLVKIGETVLKANSDTVKLGLYEEEVNRTRLFGVYEPGIGIVYQDATGSDHRLYQYAVLGFGGFSAIEYAGIDPSVIQLNEASTALLGVAHLDRLCSQGLSLEEARRKMNYIFTNHTLVQAAEASYSSDQFEHFVMPNIKSEQVINWVRDMIGSQGGRLRLSAIAIALSNRMNGVSTEHAVLVSETYQTHDGKKVECKAVINGIDDRWLAPSFLDLYRKAGVIDGFGLPAPDYEEAVTSLNPGFLWDIKQTEKANLKEYLASRVNQRGEGVLLPDDAKVVYWARRFVGYKRGGLLVAQPDKMAEILEKHNLFLVFAGSPHYTDAPMKAALNDLLGKIDRYDRMAYVQDYDEGLGFHLAAGGDVLVNIPQRGTEAAGTSHEKAAANHTFVASVRTGSVADVKGDYLEITGETEDRERESIFIQIDKAGQLLNSGPKIWAKATKTQFGSYLRVISGSRMLKDYINYALPSGQN